MAKFSTLSLTTIPSLPSCPTKLRTTFSLGHNQLQLLPMKFRYVPQQFNKGRNIHTAPTTITGNHSTNFKYDDFPTFMENGDVQVSTCYTKIRPGLLVKYASPEGGDQCQKNDQKVKVKYSILDQKRNYIKKNNTKEITVGKNELGAGFDMAIRRMSTGEEAIFVIHKDLRPRHVGRFKEDGYHVYEVEITN